jgi:hypothetical protein
MYDPDSNIYPDTGILQDNIFPVSRTLDLAESVIIFPVEVSESNGRRH